MEYMEKKIDKLLRRVSSKSRRAARRARRVANDSSSGSEFDDCSPILTPKCDRKVLANRRSLSKLSGYSKLNNIPSSEKFREEAFLTVFGIHKNHISYFHIWFIISICQLQKALTTIMRQKEKNQLLSSDSEKSDKDSKTPLQYDRVATIRRQQQFVDHHHSTNGNKSTQTFDKYHGTNEQTTQYYSTPPFYEKSCESEDADYISDYSLYSRPRKSINELDMSVDESLADLSGRESGYLSGIDLTFINRGSPSSGDSPALSPRGFSFGRERASILMRPKLKPSFTERITPVREAQIHQPESISHVARPLQERKTQQEDEASIPDYKTTESMLQSCITETKYVTAIFELTAGGIIGLIDDVLSEFNMWFNDQIGLIGAGCEVQWSCPERYRNRSAERRMKEALHWSLRQNNRRILNLKNNTGMRLPLTLVASTTEENCRHNNELDCFQGVYRRFYTSLLKYQHKETGDWHKPYWSFEDVDKCHQAPTPNPQQFIFGSQPTQLDTGSLYSIELILFNVLVTLRVTAQNALLPEKIASRLLRIRINDLDDNQPSFGEIDGSVHRVFSISETGEGTTEMMATLHADDADDPPYDSVYYYLLPTCSNRDGKFTIDKETGVITVTDYTLLQNDEYHLCAFASAYDLPAPPEIAFDNKNDSMIAFTVEVKSLKMAETLKGLPKIKFNNNTIITFGEEIYTPIPIRIDVNDELSPINYHLNSVTFIPSESSSASTEKLDYFAVDPSSGDVRIDPALADHAEGVFSLHIDAMQKSTRTSIADLITSVHNVKSSSMLKFIFDQEANLLSLNLDDFKTRLNSALNIDSSIAQISVVIGMPHSHSDSFKNRSSVCFHALRGDVILSQESAILALSATLNGDSTLSRLYQAFKVANIEPCSELERTLSSGIVVSRVTLFWVGVALLGLLILISFCLYSCFIVRYKDCLDEKKAAMNGSEAHSLPQKKPCPSVQFYSIQHLAVTDY